MNHDFLLPSIRCDGNSSDTIEVVMFLKYALYDYEFLKLQN